MNFNNPIFFTPNRVWRLYTGGKLLDRFRNEEQESDGHFPEEWLASTVPAYNGEHSQSDDEGLAKVVTEGIKGQTLSKLLKKFGPDILGEKHFQKYGENTALLCKYLDSAVRLPIQCHPDIPTAQRLYNSSFGKTECWHIISTRKIKGEEPYILLGFKKDVKQEEFKNAVYEQQIDKMIDMLHKIPVKEGDTYFVPARIPHAIGPGVFMLEVQEPSDWVIQPEQFCADIKLNIQDMWGPLAPEQGLEVFDYTGVTLDELYEKVSPSNQVLFQSENMEILELIGKKHTSSFGLRKVRIKKEAKINLPGIALFVVAKGTGQIVWGNGEKTITIFLNLTI
jgi:mannose-6-phosphate isomerase